MQDQDQEQLIDKDFSIKEESAPLEEDPQLPDAGDETDKVRVVDESGDFKIIITGGEKGGLKVSIEGTWKGRLIRSIPGAVNKAFRQLRLAKYKELQEKEA